MTDARSAILDSVRRELKQAGAHSGSASLRDYEAIPRTYTRAARLSPEARTALLLDRLEDYDAVVIRIEESQIAAAVAEILSRNRESILLAPDALPASWLPPGIEILRDGPENTALPLATLNRAQAVLTPCAGAIAETGTILLEHGPAQGRRLLTLLPDHHICVLRMDQIVETVSEGFSLLDAAKRAAITTISGPSATADIEMTRIRGVHGPRRLTVLLIAGESQLSTTR